MQAMTNRGIYINSFMHDNMSTTYRDLFKLYDLIQCGDISSIQRFLLDSNVNINAVLPCKGIGVLHLAVGIEPLDKSRQCTELLLKQGGHPNLSTEEGITPLHIAAIWGRLDNLKLLIGCGGDPSRRDIDGCSVFDYAAREEQWEVYDYLHNVEDQIDDELQCECAYTLDLDKILVKTDQVVAEYSTAPEISKTQTQTQGTACRKTDMVREWCDKTTLVMNKLYPTILSDTIMTDDDTNDWRSTNISIASNDDSQKLEITDLNESKTTYRTCFSRKITPDDVQISGIQCLEETNEITAAKDISCTCMDKQKRFSIYENFSLPCSPNSITHKNYNTKTSLKKCKNRTGSLSEEVKKLSLKESCSSDDSVQKILDRAMEVAQNKTNETNEWLSSDTTRRSSASSGVGSNFSGGGIAVASVEEEFKYTDEEEDIVFIEKRLLVSPVVLPVEDTSDNQTLDQTIVSVASSLPSSMEYDNNTLRTELLKLGFQPGPVNQSTRKLYLKKLQALKKNPIVTTTQSGKTYSIELAMSLRCPTWTNDLSGFIELENKARADFANPNANWREGTTKTSFTYLLLDPRTTENLPARATKMTQQEKWTTFVNSIFYVGKGKRSRPYSHLYQALTLWKRDFTTSKDKKVQHILDIWTNKVGVVCLHVFQNVIPAEAYTYEAAMIDVLGVTNLKNLKGGNYYGVTASWPMKERRMLGLYLLYKAMLIFLSEGERQLRPDDID